MTLASLARAHGILTMFVGVLSIIIGDGWGFDLAGGVFLLSGVGWVILGSVEDAK